MTTTVIGIDPGGSGAIAWSIDGVLNVQKLDGITESDIANVLLMIKLTADKMMAYLELVGPSRSQDGERRVQGVSSAFKFGQSYGFLRGVLAGLKIPFDDVRPQVWQKAVGIVATKMEPAEKKRRNKAKAQQLWPDEHITLKTCDAMLICEFGRRQLNGTP